MIKKKTSKKRRAGSERIGRLGVTGKLCYEALVVVLGMEVGVFKNN